MQFCPKCGSILVPEKKNNRTKLVCNRCRYKGRSSASIIITEKVNLAKEDRIEVIDKQIETLPKTKEECPKCGNGKAFYWTTQTRAGDEAETRFFECVKCKHRWRAYS